MVKITAIKPTPLDNPLLELFPIHSIEGLTPLISMNQPNNPKA